MTLKVFKEKFNLEIMPALLSLSHFYVFPPDNSHNYDSIILPCRFSKFLESFYDPALSNDMQNYKMKILN